MTEVSEYVYTTNAPKGAAKLDDEYPGWADRLNWEKFNIRSYVNCPAAQVAGKGLYWDGLRELFPAVRRDELAMHDRAREYGFHIDVSADDVADPGDRRDEFVAMWSALQADWEHAIITRRTAAD